MKPPPAMKGGHFCKESLESRILLSVPRLDSISAEPTASEESSSFTLTADVTPQGSGVSVVNFFQDTDGNGHWDKRDALISSGTAQGNARSSQPIPNPTDPGVVDFFAVAVNSAGRQSAARSISVGVELDGTVNGQPVRIDRADLPGAIIDANAVSWLFIHGLAATPEIFSASIDAVKTERPMDQILTLDWSSLAASHYPNDYSGQDSILPVGQWAGRALIKYGVSSGELNLIGQSWGADVADELARSFVASHEGKVESIVGLDAAAHVPKIAAAGVRTSYDQDARVNFGAHALTSWSFLASPLGSTEPPTTASESFIVDYADLGSPGLGHGLIIPVFTALITESPAFSLDRLIGLDTSSRPWQPNAFDEGGQGSGPVETGKVLEAQINADSNGDPLSFQYLLPGSGQLTIIPISG